MLKVEGSRIEASSLTVGDYLADWLEHMRTRVRPSTYDGYAFLIQHHALPGIGHLPLGDVHPLHIREGLVFPRARPRPAQATLPRSILANHR